VSLAGSAPRPCGHEDLNRILRPQVIGESDATQEGSVHKQEQSGRRSRPEALSGSARPEDSGVVFGAPANPMGFRPSVRDVKVQGVGKGQTSRARGDDRGLGVRVPGAEVGKR